MTLSFTGEFATAILDPSRPAPADLVSWNGSDPAQRFAVYRNNVTVTLIEALADTFPVVRALVGEHFFREMARTFVRRSPPDSPVLAWYGDAFPAFVADFPPAAGVPYLADVARLEYARVLAFHAADAEAVALAALTACLNDPAALPALVLGLHPSLRIVDSPFAIVSLWAAHQGVGDIADVVPASPECALVMRHAQSVEVMAVPAAAGQFVTALQAGATLGDALRTCGVPEQSGLPFDPSPILGILIGRGLVTGLDRHQATPGDPS